MGAGFENPTPETIATIEDELVHAINDEGIDFLERRGSLSGYAQLIREHQEEILHDKGVHTQGYLLGCTELLLGNDDAADAQLQQGSIPMEDEPQWLTEERLRCVFVRELLQQDPARARAELLRTAHRSALAMRLETSLPPSQAP